MISPQGKIVLGAVAIAVVSAALTIWLVWAWCNGSFAILAPLALAGVLVLLVCSAVFKGRGGPT